MLLALLVFTLLFSFGYNQSSQYYTPENEITATVSNTTAEVRLVGGSGPNEGRVEIFHNWRWGTICDDEWDLLDATVVCRQLGFEHATSAPGRGAFGEGTGTIWLDNVRCSGGESSLDQCDSDGWGTHNCAHYEDAGVVCGQQENTTSAYSQTHSFTRSYATTSGTTISTTVYEPIFPVRLVGGRMSYEGRVEIFHLGEWGTICGDYSWDLNDATVACRQLGFERGPAISVRNTYGGGTGNRIWPISFECNGTEDSLNQCLNNDNYTRRYYDNAAAVICMPGPSEGLLSWNQEFVFALPTTERHLTNTPKIVINNKDLVVDDVQVLVNGIGFDTTFSLGNLPVEITLPVSAQLSGTGVQDNTVIVRSSGNIIVHGMNGLSNPDGFLALPNSQQGLVYYVASYIPYGSSQFAVSSHSYETRVNITTPQGSIENLVLQPYKSYQYLFESDLTGTRIEADNPITVMAGADKANIPTNIIRWDSILEQMIPVRLWGKHYVLAPFMGIRNGYRYRIISGEESAHIFVSGSHGRRNITLNGNFYEGHENGYTVTTIESDKPVLVAEYMENQPDIRYWYSIRRQPGAPSMMLVFPTNLYTDTMAFPVFPDVTSYITVIGNCKLLQVLALNYKPIEMFDWNRVNSSDGETCVFSKQVQAGTYNLNRFYRGDISYEEGKFTCNVYGYTYGGSSYTYPGGLDDIHIPNNDTSWAIETTTTAPNTPSKEDVQTEWVTFVDIVSVETVPPEDYQRERTSWIDCEGSFMTVFVNRSFIQDGIASDLHLLDSRCRGVYYDEHFIEMQSMYDLCGTTVEQGENGTMIFKNEILYIPSSSANDAKIVSRDFALRIPLTCRMNTGGIALMTSFHPNMRTVKFEEENFGSFGFQLLMFRDDSFRTSYDVETDYPVQVHVKDTVYFEAKVNSRQNLKLFVDTCRATPSPNPSDTPNYVILKNGCPKDDTFHLMSSSQPTVQRFSLEAFAFIGRFSTVFVHCDMLVCKLNDSNSRCVQGCRSRGRRDLMEDKSSRLYSLNQGPLVVQRGPPNLRNRRAAPENLNLDDGQESYSSNKITLLGTGFLVAMCLIAVFIGLVSRGKRLMHRIGVWPPASATEHRRDEN